MTKQRWLTTVFAALISVASLLVVTRPAEAWGRWGYGGYGWPYYSWGGWGWGYPYYGYSYYPYGYSWGYWGSPYATYYPSYYYPTYYSASVPRYTYATPVQSFYYSPNTTDSRAHLTVELPSPNARVWIEGQQMRQDGTVRTFESPALSPGEYTYSIRARWQQNGREQDQTQTVHVRPGRDVTVRFGS